MRDPGGPVTIPFTYQMSFAQTDLSQLQQAIQNFNVQLSPGTLTFNTAVSRLQSLSTITLLERTLPNQSQLIIDLIAKGTIDWASGQGLRIKPDLAAHVHLLNYNDFHFTLYGEAKFTVVPSNGTGSVEFIGGGLQIQWGGRLGRGQAQRPRH
jgi:hypothetical protein